jgi:hypothetical protein
MTRFASVIAIILTLAGCGGDDPPLSTDMAITCANGRTQAYGVACCDSIQPGSAYPAGSCLPSDVCYDYEEDLRRCFCDRGYWACYVVHPRDLSPIDDGGSGTD